MASIPAMRWATQSHESPNIEGFNDMFNAAAGAMEAIGLTRVKRNPDDVSGVSPDTLTAITCLRCGNIFTLLVMVAGNNSSHTKIILDKLLHEIPKHIPNL